MQQIAPPSEVYSQPANLDVARFMGYRNVIDLAVEREDGERVTVAGAGIRLDGIRKQPLAGGRAAVAIRPEEIVVADGPGGANTMAGRVDNVEYCGRDSLVDVVTPDGIRLHVRTHVADRAGRRGARPRAGRARARLSGRLMRWRPPRHRSPAPRSTACCCWSYRRAAFMLLLFVYPFLYGLALSFEPKEGGALGNYAHFFTTDNLWPTIWTTLRLALPATLINVVRRAADRLQDAREVALPAGVTTILVVPITLGTVLIAEGMLTYFGPKGWLSQFLQLLHLYDGPIRLTHNYWGVLISLVVSGFPFAFLLILSYITGIDPVLARAASTLGADPRRSSATSTCRCWRPDSRCASASRSCRRSRCFPRPCCWARRPGRRG